MIIFTFSSSLEKIEFINGDTKLQGLNKEENKKLNVKIIIYGISICILFGIAVKLFISITDASTNEDIKIEESNLGESSIEDIEKQTTVKIEEVDKPANGLERPSKEMVLNMRNKVTEGMSEEEISRITENIKVANHVLEEGYLYDRLFERLEDPEDLYWNYIYYKGDIQIGWALSEKHYDASSGLSRKEFNEKYGTPVMTYNRFDADNFINLMTEMRDSLKTDLLKADFDNIINCIQLAKENRDVEYIIQIYRIVHDMDYFLFRYGIEDVGRYVDDISTISKYYGVLTVYE